MAGSLVLAPMAVGPGHALDPLQDPGDDGSPLRGSRCRLVASLNRRLRGWGNYFRWGNSARKFHLIDGYVHQRLAIFMSTKHGLRRRRNWARFDREWVHSVGVYQLTGTVRSRPAHA